jgi:hypothetical protein
MSVADLARAKVASLRQAPRFFLPPELHLAAPDVPPVRTEDELAARAAETEACLERNRQRARDAFARVQARRIDRGGV